RLGIAEENSGKLVSLIRREGMKLAQEKNLDLLLTDGPPGVGCPVIASLGGASAVLIVAEPTVSGKHDMERVSELAAFFKVPAMLCINKFDLNPGMGQAIEAFAKEKNIRVIGRVPFDHAFTHAMVQGKTIVEFDEQGEGSRAVKDIWGKLAESLEN
ncbi:MAG TPA: (4Fe-4S)-binding protein, partial [Deltaproteobacteria bacterium]|nr:(4Fe-4S)-binding protein [Deltaproteobacteria bacterium]